MKSPAPTQERNVAKVVFIAIGMLFISVAVTVISRSIADPDSEPQVVGRVVLVETGSEREVRVTLQVEKDPAAAAECDVSAFDDRGSSVGRIIGVPVGASASGQKVVTQIVVVATPLGRASTAAVATCRLTSRRPGAPSRPGSSGPGT